MMALVPKSMTLWLCAVIGVLFIAEAMVGTVGRRYGRVGSLQVNDNWQNDPTNGEVDDESASTVPDDVYDNMDTADPDVDAAPADDVDTAQAGDLDETTQNDSDTDSTSDDSSDDSSDDGSINVDDTPDSGDSSDSDVPSDQADASADQ